MKGKQVTHIAPTSEMVTGLMKDLFSYLKKDEDLEIIDRHTMMPLLNQIIQVL